MGELKTVAVIFDSVLSVFLHLVGREHLLAVVLWPMGHQGDENIDPWPRRSWQDDHPVQTTSRRGRHNHTK